MTALAGLLAEIESGYRGLAELHRAAAKQCAPGSAMGARHRRYARHIDEMRIARMALLDDPLQIADAQETEA